jgi:hypothetical protein
MKLTGFALAAAFAAFTLNAGTAKVESANQMLAEALANMYKLNFMHARAEFHHGNKTATVVAGMGQSSTVMDVVEFSGKHSQGALIGQDSFVSDDGKKWVKETQDVGGTRFRAVFAPIAAGAKIPEQATFAVAGVETVDGMQAVKLVGVKNLKAEYWIVNDPKYGKLVRKVHTMLAMDQTVEEWVTYYDYNVPVAMPAIR